MAGDCSDIVPTLSISEQNVHDPFPGPRIGCPIPGRPSAIFEDHAELLAKVKLSSALGGRTVSLQERQMEVLREKVKTMELRLSGLMRIAQENDSITDKFLDWTRSLLLARNDVDLPHVLISGLQTIFSVPHATLRIWGVAESLPIPGLPHRSPTTRDCSRRVCTLRSADPTTISRRRHGWMTARRFTRSRSCRCVSARCTDAFGLLVLGSPDPTRFTSDMATDFLTKIGQTTRRTNLPAGLTGAPA